MRLQCPICHVTCIQEVLQDYHVQVRRSQDKRVGGLQALTCSNGHIFFVRKLDVAIERASGAAA